MRPPLSIARATALTVLALVISCNRGAPRISFYETEHDFGKVGREVQLIHEFRFINRGTGALHIHKVGSD